MPKTPSLPGRARLRSAPGLDRASKRWTGPEVAPGPDTIQYSSQAGAPIGTGARPFADEQADRDARRAAAKVSPATPAGFKLDKW